MNEATMKTAKTLGIAGVAAIGAELGAEMAAKNEWVKAHANYYWAPTVATVIIAALIYKKSPAAAAGVVAGGAVLGLQGYRLAKAQAPTNPSAQGGTAAAPSGAPALPASAPKPPASSSFGTLQNAAQSAANGFALPSSDTPAGQGADVFGLPGNLGTGGTIPGGMNEALQGIDLSNFPTLGNPTGGQDAGAVRRGRYDAGAVRGGSLRRL
jgi:hypothetical protein